MILKSLDRHDYPWGLVPVELIHHLWRVSRQVLYPVREGEMSLLAISQNPGLLALSDQTQAPVSLHSQSASLVEDPIVILVALTATALVF